MKSRNWSTPILAVLLTLACLGLLSPRASAHAIVTESNPPPNSTVMGPDVKIKLRFNARIDQSRSRLVVVSPSGAKTPLPIGDGAAADVLAGEAKGLRAGSYSLHWQVLANDGHITSGEIRFSVRAP
jgi:methionine-rich copper-binding protein CopC